MKGWQYRWFVLDENSGLLSYYTSKEKMMRGVRRGCVRLKGAVIGIDDEDDSTFTITVDHKTFHFQARDGEEREKWVRALEDTIFRHGTRVRWDSTGIQPTIKDFDNKVSEADAYLQLMIEQTNKLESRIQNIDDIEEKHNYEVILQNANTMLDDIKHSIVLLQIAKNTAHPINGIYPLVNNLQSTSNPIYSESNSNVELNVQSNLVELGSECIESVRRHASLVGNPNVFSVPETSYSSSEGEDDFFDANDSPFSAGSHLATPTSTASNSTQVQQVQQQSINTQTTGGGISGGPSSNVPRGSFGKVTIDVRQHRVAIQDGSATVITTAAAKEGGEHHLDYDEFYEDEQEADVQMEAQGSVIKHLLSQVKIGMDLTKVVLPTFILERRSLLEMYADYFAHPDLFVQIADEATPRERIIQVLRWYLSSYHAGRKSAVAKKPYNPILGETFKCHWDIPPPSAPSLLSTSTTCDKQPVVSVTDGPVPWCKQDQLSFVAEQVSHHPPISAFYAEHYSKRITFNAHIYTKSKFLGLSICVYNVGQGIVNLLDRNEQYIVTFPNGYGRSILTVPWIELGGTVTIRCPQTGYNGQIEFQLKPFYGNRKHKIAAELYAPEDKKPFLTVTGEWNGVMEGKFINDKENDEEFVINTADLSIVKKQVRPISQQGETESRRLWMDVTAGLKLNDIEKATKAKTVLEQKQREGAKDRKDNNLQWETKLFVKTAEENWFYTNPLELRLLESSQESK